MNVDPQPAPDPRLRRLEPGMSLTIDVDPRALYVPTGLVLGAGERYRLTADGKWRDGFVTCGPEGWGRGWPTRFNRLPGQPFFLLCGCPGRNDQHAFAVGTARDWEVPDAADPDGLALYLFANDWRWMYWNNRALTAQRGGPLRVTITRLP
ncbi:hypothetical protein [Thioalkalivibrio paradoxus]|uniref:Uncharacterized protein n=1 Tax=Thioalkalivibrio paradoxus ARh 1 TaxID=713585 RepID=W0DT17_9GAMM|nr:hypothetical protein [Thioalkalivibrio paradoxus]AHF00016.1 hypothetical protein THITH_06530 [Thioalkalivibrio paradoxus ARh 1]